MIQQQFLVPSSIDIPAILSGLGYSERYIYDHQDKFNYILHLIEERKVFDSSIESGGYSCLHLDTVRSVIGSRYASEVIKTLLRKGIIQCDGKKLYGDYGSKSYGYRIHPDFESKAILRNVFKDETMGKKLRERALSYKQRHSRSLRWKHLTKLRIRTTEALEHIDAKLNASLDILDSHQTETQVPMLRENRKAIEEACQKITEAFREQEQGERKERTPTPTPYSLIPLQLIINATLSHDNQCVNLDKYLRSLLYGKYNSDLRSIQKLAVSDFFIEQPDPESRVFTNLSNLSGHLRQFLYHSEHVRKELINLDIRNSQPYLFSLLLMDKYRGGIVPDSVSHYIALTANGEFYEHMMELMGLPLDSTDKAQRIAFKKRFFATLFFCKTQTSKASAEGKVFRAHFPEVAALIDLYKERGYEQLAITMQRREAGVILKTISAQLAQEGIWHATIHDSVVVLREHQENVKALIIQAFLISVGVAPTVKPEQLNPYFV
ncbi:hypothetical protein [Hymenobacter convexus]|uniref:hypothetical protein n=1 Tax=Hymenobacter sp. CA1UV-4 TaxID=3063782 RepID=UPI0027134DFE|nr:hypothetical protein [Hymenobacter sp. CA1UV-4]MDO7852958.1 hypothetical protein [Hymenobacter sp. CA1UV-4]